MKKMKVLKLWKKEESQAVKTPLQFDQHKNYSNLFLKTIASFTFQELFVQREMDNFI